MALNTINLTLITSEIKWLPLRICLFVLNCSVVADHDRSFISSIEKLVYSNFHYRLCQLGLHGWCHYEKM